MLRAGGDEFQHCHGTLPFGSSVRHVVKDSSCSPSIICATHRLSSSLPHMLSVKHVCQLEHIDNDSLPALAWEALHLLDDSPDTPGSRSAALVSLACMAACS